MDFRLASIAYVEAGRRRPEEESLQASLVHQQKCNGTRSAVRPPAFAETAAQFATELIDQGRVRQITLPVRHETADSTHEATRGLAGEPCWPLFLNSKRLEANVPIVVSVAATTKNRQKIGGLHQTRLHVLFIAPNVLTSKAPHVSQGPFRSYKRAGLDTPARRASTANLPRPRLWGSALPEARRMPVTSYTSKARKTFVAYNSAAVLRRLPRLKAIQLGFDLRPGLFAETFELKLTAGIFDLLAGQVDL